MQYNFAEEQKQQQSQFAHEQHLTRKPIKDTSSAREHFHHVTKTVKSAPNRLLQRPTSFESHRSLSSCPTYSSLSRHSPETRDCATQITTYPRAKSSKEKYVSCDPMPISSGFGYYPYNYPTTRTDRISPARTDSARSKVPPRRPPEMRPSNGKQSPRSDSFPTRRNSNTRVPRTNDHYQQPPPQQRRQAPPPPPPPPDDRRQDARRNNGTTRVVRHSDPMIDSEDIRRKPLRFASNDPSYRPIPPPARDPSNQPVPSRVPANREFVIERRRRPGASIGQGQQGSVYVYEDYRDGTPVETSSSPRIVRVVRDRPHRDPDDVYYVESEPQRVVYETRPSRRQTIVRRSSPEYVYVDEAPTTAVRRRERIIAAPPRKEVIYVDESEIEEQPRRQQKVEYVDEYVYVDENGNEVEVVREQNPSSSKYGDYVYEDEIDQRRSKPSKVIYEDEIDQRRSKPSKVVYVDSDGKSQKKSKQSTTKVIYD